MCTPPPLSHTQTRKHTPPPPPLPFHTHAHREEISKSRLNRLRGLDNHERIDEELYADFETEDAKKVCLGVYECEFRGQGVREGGGVKPHMHCVQAMTQRG